MDYARIGAAAALVLSVSTVAQEVDAGRQALAECYSKCLVRYENASQALIARLDRITDKWLSDEVNELVDDQYVSIMDGERLKLCIQWAASYRDIEGCDIGCLDTEIAYGTKVAHTRARFKQAIIGERDEITEAGLWKGYNYQWQPDEFERACRGFFDSAATQSAPPSAKVAPTPVAGARKGG